MGLGWRACLGIGAVAVLGYFALPGRGVQATAYVTFEVLSGLLVAAGSWRASAVLRWGWRLVAVAQLLWALADGLDGHGAGRGSEAAVSWADVVHLGGYVPMFAGLVVFVARHRGRADVRAAVLDSATVTTGAGLLAWQLLVQPGFADDPDGVPASVVSASYPLLDVALLGALGMVAMVVPHRVSSSGWFRLLTAAVVVLLVTDSVYRIVTVVGTYRSGGVLDAGWLAAYVLVAAAALHPSARRQLQRPPGSVGGERAGTRFIRSRLAVLMLALLCAPFALFAEETPLHDEHSHWPVITACVLLSSILVARLGGLAFTAQDDRERLEVQARTDALTGLANRSWVMESFGRALLHRDSYPLAVLLVDLDHFKDINDTFGHAVGDTVLREVGSRLTAAVGPDDVVARTGGDEFTILAPRTATAIEAEKLGRRVRTTLGAPVVVAGLSLLSEGSVGVAWTPRPGPDAPTLLRQADVALYVAKSHPAGVQRYRPEHERDTVDRMTLLGELQRALAQDELVLHYQPQVSLSTGRTTGAEALVRWQHPTRGLLGPQTFLEAAEQTGLVTALTRTVLDQAIRQARTWCVEERPVPVSVNLSARNLRDTTLVDDVRTALHTHQLPPSMLTLEITESSVMGDPERSLQVLTRLRNMGVRLSIDDYGTGYSSLAYLQRLPVSEIKIDKSFVTHLVSRPSDAAIVQSTIELARRLDLVVVAEGVEDDLVLDQLRTWGCPTAQGYHLGRPTPAHDLSTALGLRENARPAGPRA